MGSNILRPLGPRYRSSCKRSCGRVSGSSAPTPSSGPSRLACPGKSHCVARLWVTRPDRSRTSEVIPASFERQSPQRVPWVDGCAAAALVLHGAQRWQPEVRPTPYRGAGLSDAC